jgi:excisionase family DNA binding protein
MTTSRISKDTAKLGSNLLRTMAKQNLLPSSEARAAAAVLMDATKSPKSDSKPDAAKPRLLTTAQAAECLSCSRKTVLRMADDGQLTRRYLRPGNPKSLRFSEAELAALCTLPADEPKP